MNPSRLAAFALCAVLTFSPLVGGLHGGAERKSVWTQADLPGARGTEEAAWKSVAPAGKEPKTDGGFSIESVRQLLEEALRASGVSNQEEVGRYVALFRMKVEDILQRAARPRSPYRRAQRLHAALHDKIFLRYSAAATGIDSVLDSEEYNCVSATLLWGIAARLLGLEARVVEGPRHVFLRLGTGKRNVDIESTSADGFDLRRNPIRFRRFILAYKLAAPEDPPSADPGRTPEKRSEHEAEGASRELYAALQEAPGEGAAVSLEQGVAFLWHNTAERHLDQGEPLQSARDFREVFRLYPDLARRSDALAGSLARAFRIEYEAGRFETAYQIAAIELEIFGQKTSTRDRFLAVASKRIEGACEAGRAAEAQEILDSSRALLSAPSDGTRLERQNAPRIAAAAVTTGDWRRAREMAERFASVEADIVEGARFIEWVESRQVDAADPERQTCREPRRFSPTPVR